MKKEATVSYIISTILACSRKLTSSLQSDSDDSDDSDADSDDSDSDDSDNSDSDSESADEKTEAPSKKRKAEEETAAPAKKNKTEEGEESSTLFVGNLSWKVDDAALFEEFQSSTGCTNARIITGQDGRPRGFGYVDFDSAENAKAALEAKQGGYLDNRDMRIDLSSSKPKTDFKDRANDRAKKFNDELSPESETVFVGNLSFNVDEESVSAFFNEVANVKSLRLPTEQ